MKNIYKFLTVSAFICSLLFLVSCESEPTETDIKINLDELTIGQIHEAFIRGQYTSEDLVKAYTRRIELYDDSINSITIINPKALERARQLDKEFAETGKLKPLHGIPLIVKDNINTIGVPTTAGSLALKDFYPQENAFVIKQLEKAGAIVFAKSNMAEWAFSPMHNESSTAGITRNPFNLAHVPAGSSGGTGAAISSNFGAVGLGTDTGNSIRGPSSHNALVGIRSTLGLSSREGIIPLYLRNDVVGPMSRTVEDAARVLGAMTGLDEKDSLTFHSKGQFKEDYTQYLDKNGLSGARIGVLRELSEDKPHPEIKALFEKALVDLSNQGVILIDPMVVPEFANLRKNQWCSEFRNDLETFLSEYVKSDTVKTLEDVVRIGSKSEYTTNRVLYFTKNSGRRGENPLPCLDAYTDEQRIAFRSAIEKVMDSLQLDAVVYPTWNNPPALIDKFSEGYKGDNNQIIAPHTGQPAITVPMGFVSGNLPAGLQFLGRMYDEPVLIRLAYSYEQATTHRKVPQIEALK